MATQYLRFDDLKRRQIVNNRTTLQRWISTLDFPAGILLGPRTRAWPDDEVTQWVERRRTEQRLAGKSTCQTG